MELRDGDVELRAWTLDDVPALVAACNDDEIQRWLPMIPRPYTDDDARAFVGGKVSDPGRRQFAITEGDRVVGAIGLDVTESIRQGTIGYWCGMRGARPRPHDARAASAIGACVRGHRPRAPAAVRRSGQPRLTTRRREGRIPARGRRSLSSATARRHAARLDRLLAASRRAGLDAVRDQPVVPEGIDHAPLP